MDVHDDQTYLLDLYFHLVRWRNTNYHHDPLYYNTDYKLVRFLLDCFKYEPRRGKQQFVVSKRLLRKLSACNTELYSRSHLM